MWVYFLRNSNNRRWTYEPIPDDDNRGDIDLPEVSSADDKQPAIITRPSSLLSVGFGHLAASILLLLLLDAIGLAVRSSLSAVFPITTRTSDTRSADLWPTPPGASTHHLHRAHNHGPYHYHNDPVHEILLDLDKAMNGKILFRESADDIDEQFYRAVHVWNELAQCSSTATLPRAVVLPTQEHDIQLAVPVLTQLSALYNVPFRIRSGGHSLFNPDQSTIPDGIVLNLHHLNGIKMNSTTKVATIGPAIKVEDMLRTFLKAENYSTTIGFCPNVAEGGYIGGGGWGPSLRQHGLAIDNVLSIRAVLANGTSVVASKDLNADLFWGLRGGGHGTLAVMTEFQLQLHPTTDSTPLVTGAIPWQDVPNFLYHLGEMEKSNVLDRRVFLLVEGCEEAGLPLQLGWVASDESSLQEGSRYLQHLIQHLSAPSKERQRQAMTTPLNSSSSSSSYEFDVVSWTDLATAPDQYYDGYMWKSFFGLLFPENNTLDSWTRITDSFSRVAHTNPSATEATTTTNPYVLIEIGLFGGATSDVDPVDTAYFHRTALYNVGFYIAVPVDIDNAEAVFKQQVGAVAPIWSELRNEGFLEGAYPNYQIGSLSDEEYAQQYWGGNVAKLQSVKSQYDPANVFYHSQGIPPLLQN